VYKASSDDGATSLYLYDLATRESMSLVTSPLGVGSVKVLRQFPLPAEGRVDRRLRVMLGTARNDQPACGRRADYPSPAPAASFGTTRRVAAPTPNRVGHIFPQAVHVEIDAGPSSGSVVPFMVAAFDPLLVRLRLDVDRHVRPSSRFLLRGAGRRG